MNLENEATLLIFAKIVALTLLPAHDIVETYYWIVESMNDAQLREFRDFIDNYYEVWLNNITPSKYSCYNDQLQLIKNMELILKNMVHSLRQKKIWDFLGKYPQYPLLTTTYYKITLKITSRIHC